ncbi:MAG: hypothetical protein M3N26_10165 [Pseudomonadota bacterium]|nr:hypothetical protein [Pseudomonadota bacterium]
MTRWMLLAEDDLALGAVGSPPVRDAALERTQMPLVETAGMITADLLHYRRRAQQRHLVQHRHDDLVPQTRQRIEARPPARLAGLARNPP